MVLQTVSTILQFSAATLVLLFSLLVRVFFFFHYYNIAFAPDIAPIRFYIVVSWNGNNCIPSIYLFIFSFFLLNVSSPSTTAPYTSKMCMNFMVCTIVRYITFTVDAVRKWLKHSNELIVRVLWFFFSVINKVHFHLNCKLLLLFVTIKNYCIGLCVSGRWCRLFVSSHVVSIGFSSSIRCFSPPSISQYHSVEHRTQDLFQVFAVSCWTLTPFKWKWKWKRNNANINKSWANKYWFNQLIKWHR